MPTGKARDEVFVEALNKSIPISAIDISNVLVLVRSEDLGMRGDELPAQMAANRPLMDIIECIRGKVAQQIGLVSDYREAAVKTAGSPKLAVISPAHDYTDIKGRLVKKQDMDVCVRVVSVGQPHKASPLTSATAIGGAAFIDGSILQDVLGGAALTDSVRIGHPSGVMKVYAFFKKDQNSVYFSGIAGQRTARVLMEGVLHVRDK